MITEPQYDFTNKIEKLLIPDIEWGKGCVLPKIDHSGRWENMPICMPSLMTYDIVPNGVGLYTCTIPKHDSNAKYVAITGEIPPKIHKVIACKWVLTMFGHDRTVLM